MSPGVAALLYLALGALYAGALLADMKRDRIPLMRFVVWYQTAQVIAFWPLVGAGHAVALIRGRWFRKRRRIDAQGPTRNRDARPRALP